MFGHGLSDEANRIRQGNHEVPAMNRIEKLIDTPYYIIDILPEQVPPCFPGRYTDVERYLLEDPELRRRQINILLKLYCYYDLAIVCGDEMKEHPSPDDFAELVGKKYLNILIGDALIVSDHTDTYMTLYNADDRMLMLTESIASSEGLFVWQPRMTGE